MARFDDNWEKEFKPSWETSVTTNQVGKSNNPNENRVVRYTYLDIDYRVADAKTSFDPL